MNDTKQIEWIGPERILPCYGLAAKGRVFPCDTKRADSFIQQKLAKEVKSKGVKDVRTND